MIASTDSSATGRCSISPRRNSTVSASFFSTFSRARSTISGVMSTPMTRPSGPTSRAARKQSNPPPDPRSRTVSPGSSPRSPSDSRSRVRGSPGRDGVDVVLVVAASAGLVLGVIDSGAVSPQQAVEPAVSPAASTRRRRRRRNMPTILRRDVAVPLANGVSLFCGVDLVTLRAAVVGHDRDPASTPSVDRLSSVDPVSPVDRVSSRSASSRSARPVAS